jgi:hypothetical protein
MATRPAYVWTGSDFDEIGDKRLGPSVTALNSALAAKSANPKTIDTKTANYTLVLGDKDKIVQMNSTSARTITIPTNASVAFAVGTIVHVANINTGTLTIAGASGVTVSQSAGLTLAQWESATLYQRAANSWVMLKGGGLGAANFSNASTGTYTDGGGVSWKYVTFNASGTLTVTKDGFADVLVIGGGAAGGNAAGGGGGAGGHLYIADEYLAAGSLTVTVGAGGAGITTSSSQGRPGNNGQASRVGSYYSPGGGGGASLTRSNTGTAFGMTGLNGGSGGGAGLGDGNTGGAGVSNLGNSGGNATGVGVNTAAGGGGGRGAGGGNATSGAGNGGSGVVIVRVKV